MLDKENLKATKQKIFDAAIRLFNQNGLVNVRLQHIADEANMSVGNLAYHYYSKKALVLAVDEQLNKELNLLLSIDQNFPYLIDFDNHLTDYYFLLKKYSFYFLDVLEIERGFPKVNIKRRIYIEQMIHHFYRWIQLNTEKGIFKKELQENQYLHTAETIWIIITFWLTQQKVRGKPSSAEGAFKEVIWNQLVPIFRESGFMEYEAIILPQIKQHTN